MGIHSSADQTFGLNPSNRLLKILKVVRAKETLSEEDLLYLIDNAGRFETLWQRVYAKDYPIKDNYLDEEFELKEIMKDMIVELMHTYPSKINEDQTYKLELPHFNPNSEDAIERLAPDSIMLELRRSIRMVQSLQKTYDENGDSLTVIGTYPHLKKAYGIKLTVKADTTLDDILLPIVTRVREVVEKDLKKKDTAFKRLTELQSSQSEKAQR